LVALVGRPEMGVCYSSCCWCVCVGGIRWEDLLPGEADRAARALEAWRNSSACEAKLTAALQEGCSTALLSRLITEAAGAGVKVSHARRVLKLQQGLEAAMATVDQAAGSSQQYGQLAAKLEAAEHGCVAQSLLAPARQLLHKLQAAEARSALEAALKPHSDWSVNTKVAALKAALDKAEDVLGPDEMDALKQQQQQQQQWHQEQEQGDANPLPAVASAESKAAVADVMRQELGGAGHSAADTSSTTGSDDALSTASDGGAVSDHGAQEAV